MSIVLPDGARGATAPAFEPPPTEPGPAPAGEPTASGPTRRWVVPPIGVWGSLAYEYRREQAQAREPLDRRETSTQQLAIAKIDASSFIYRPWFATISGGVGLTYGLFSADSSESTRDRIASGHAQLQLFPRSRFPFEAHLDLSDTRFDSALSSLPPARLFGFGVSQSYRPEIGPYSLTGSFDHHSQTGEFGNDTQDMLNIGAEANWPRHRASLGGSWNHNTRARTGESQDFATLVGRHSYVPSPTFTVESTANLTRNALDLEEGSTDTTVAQLTSIAQWRPEERPYTVTGSARLFAASAGGTTAQGANVTAGGTYRFSENLSVSAGAGVGVLTGSGESSFSHSESASVSYNGDTRRFGGFSYDWNANASFSNSGASESSNVAVISADIGHALTRNWPLSDSASIAVTVGQSFGAGTSTESIDEEHDTGTERTSTRLGHSASIGINKSADNASGYARLSISDSRRIGGDGDSFQLANLQIAGTWQFSRYSSLIGDLTAQYTRQQSSEPRLLLEPGLPARVVVRTKSTALSANIVFRHNRLFGVPRLAFSSELRASDDEVIREEELSLVPKRESRAWENRLDYTIGRLTTSLSLRLSEIDDRRVGTVMFRIQRDFGAQRAW
jgi:hypothetical protein